MKNIVSIVILGLCALGIWKGIALSELQKEQTILKEHYAEINKINYGLFNVQLWKDKAFDIFEDRIQDFTLSPQVYEDVQGEVESYLRDMYVEYIASGKLIDGMIEEAEKSGKLNKMFAKLIKDNVGTQISNMNLQNRIPSVAAELTKELKKKEPQIKGYLRESLEQMLFEGNELVFKDPRQPIFDLYAADSMEDANETIKAKILENEETLNSNIKFVYILLLGAVLLITLLYKVIGFNTFISLLTFVSVILLVLGVTMPMIDIDARLNSFRLDILGNEVAFDEQVLYFQSKSILDVTETLLEGRGLDLKIVGILILFFSIIFPFIKLVLSALFLYLKKVRNSKIAKAFIFYLGKWSMADVFVVAMFMAYIGFYGLVTSQLGMIARNDGGYAVETLNYSRLAPGVLFFTTYCVLSIVIGIVINRWDLKSEDSLD